MFKVTNRDIRTVAFDVGYVSLLNKLLTLSNLFYFYVQLWACISLQSFLIFLNKSLGIACIYQETNSYLTWISFCWIDQWHCFSIILLPTRYNVIVTKHRNSSKQAVSAQLRAITVFSIFFCFFINYTTVQLLYDVFLKWFLFINHDI